MVRITKEMGGKEMIVLKDHKEVKGLEESEIWNSMEDRKPYIVGFD